MTENLKACPFCDGTELHETEQGGWYRWVCNSCKAMGPPGDYMMPEASILWNTRAPDPLPEASQ